MSSASLFDTSVNPKKQVIPGPIPARVLFIRDGDTIRVLARLWPGLVMASTVRFPEIEAPELKPRAKCKREHEAAIEARDFLSETAKPGDIVFLSNVRLGKFQDRVFAQVRTEDGLDLAGAMLDGGQAVPYENRKAHSWCP